MSLFITYDYRSFTHYLSIDKYRTHTPIPGFKRPLTTSELLKEHSQLLRASWCIILNPRHLQSIIYASGSLRIYTRPQWSFPPLKTCPFMFHWGKGYKIHYFFGEFLKTEFQLSEALWLFQKFYKKGTRYRFLFS